MRAGGNPQADQPGTLRRLDIVRRVAHEGADGGREAELVHRRAHGSRVRFALLHVVVVDYDIGAVEQIEQVGLLQRRMQRLFLGGRSDAGLQAALGEGVEQVVHPGKGPDALLLDAVQVESQVGVPQGLAMFAFGLFPHERRHEQAAAFADFQADPVFRDHISELLEGQVPRTGMRCRRIDQGAVEVEDEGLQSHEGIETDVNSTV